MRYIPSVIEGHYVKAMLNSGATIGGKCSSIGEYSMMLHDESTDIRFIIEKRDIAAIGIRKSDYADIKDQWAIV